MAKETVEGTIGNEKVVLNNAATEATLVTLVETFEKMSKARGEKPADVRKKQKEAEKYARSQKKAAEETEDFSGQIEASTNALQDFRSGLGKVGGALGFVASSLTGLVSGTYNLVESFMLGGNRISSFLGDVPLLGTFADVLDENIDTYRNISNVGASFGNSLEEFRLTAARARLPLESFQNLVKNNAETLAIFGSNVSSGAKRFASFSGAFRESDVGERFMGMGMTVEDLNDRLAGYIELQARQGRLERLSQQQLTDGATQYLEELEALTKITGMERDQAEQAMLAQQQEARLRVMRGEIEGEEARSRFDANMALLDQLGPLGTAFKDLADGAVNTEDAQNALAVLGPRALTLAQQMGRGAISAEESRNQLAEFGPQIERFARQVGVQGLQQLGMNAQSLAMILDEGARLQRLNNNAQEDLTDEEIKIRNRATEVLNSFEQTVSSVRSRIVDVFLTNRAWQTSVDNLEEFAKLIGPENISGLLDQHLTPALERFNSWFDNFLNDIRDIGLTSAITNAVADLFNNIKTFIFGGERVVKVSRPSPSGDFFQEEVSREERQGLISKFADGFSNWYDESGLKSVFERMAQDITNFFATAITGRKLDEDEKLSREEKKRLNNLNIANEMGDDLSDEQMAELEQLKSVYERNRAIEMGLIGLIPGVKGEGESGIGLFKGPLSRRTGSPGIENFGEGTPAMLHGREAVLTEDQLFKMARGTFAAGSNIAVNNLLGSELFKIASGAFSAGVSNSRPRLDENRMANITDESNSRPRLDENRMANITNDAFSKVLQDSKSRLSENEINRIASNAFSADRLNSLLQVDQKLRQIEKDADNTNLISAITDLKDSYSSVSPSDNQTVNNDLTQKVDQLNSTMQDVLTVLVNSHDVEKRQLQSFRNSGNNLYKSIG